MEFFVSGSSIRKAEEIVIRNLHVPSIVLMENAGRAVAKHIFDEHRGARRAVVFCGPGNNGGDGFVAARHLAAAAFPVTVVVTQEPKKYKGDAAVMLAACRDIDEIDDIVDIELYTNMSDDRLIRELEDAVIVDAVLGTGASGAPRGGVKAALTVLGRIDALRSSRALTLDSVISVDVPSGVNADTGAACEGAVSADITITFGMNKIGLAIAPGCIRAGRAEVAVIGVDLVRPLMEHVLEDESSMIVSHGTDDMPLYSEKIPRDAHKGTRGGLLVIGGSDAFRGAPLLTARAALRAGCGYVFLAAPDSVLNAAASYLPEAILISLSNLSDTICELSHKIDAIAIGPGLGRSDATAELVKSVTEEAASRGIPIIYDGDALRYLAEIGESPAFEHAIITPHEGEAAVMLGIDAERVRAERLESVRRLTEKFGIVLLKGPHTIIGKGRGARVIAAGGPELAIPGSGDVLTGAIGALVAQDMMNMFDAATRGALIHARAAERTGLTDGILATELADALAERAEEEER